MITHDEFKQLRLRSFLTEVDPLEGWSFMGRQWIGEAVGFTQWLRPVEAPEQLGSVSIDLMDLSQEVSTAMIETLGLPLRPGMDLHTVTELLGKPTSSEQFVPDRSSYDFILQSGDPFELSCTIHNDDGLIYLVVNSTADHTVV